MYELISHTVVEPRLREVRRRSLPSIQRRREQERELCLIDDARPVAVAVDEASGRRSFTHLSATLRRWRGLGVAAR